MAGASDFTMTAAPPPLVLELYATYMILSQQFYVFEFVYLNLSHVSTAQITSPAQVPAQKTYD